MNRLRVRFAKLRTHAQRALLPYITAGYPNTDVTIEILRRLDPQRCACVELGIPFSDPIADGPVIQASFAAALQRGFRLDAFLESLAAARQAISVPLVAMVSYSIVYRRRPASFVAAARAAGIDGLIVPDLAFEEASELSATCREHGCPLVLMVAPTTAADRQAQIAALSEPFIYYQSLAGVTGERSELPVDLAEHVAALRRLTDKPICVGFGISSAEHVRQVCRVADGAIVGSAIVRRLGEEGSPDAAALATRVARFISDLAVGASAPD